VDNVLAAYPPAAEEAWRTTINLARIETPNGRFYYQRGIDAVIFGIGGDGQHGPDEYADIATIEPYYRALQDFLISAP
jgi:succinyl-diaminopimelate desuccinylase